MKVCEFIAELQKLPQDMEIYVLDADENCLLRTRPGDFEVRKADKNYPFDRAEIQVPYSDGVEDRRVEMDHSWWNK